MALFKFDNFICEQKLMGLWGCKISVENIYGNENKWYSTSVSAKLWLNQAVKAALEPKQSLNRKSNHQ